MRLRDYFGFGEEGEKEVVKGLEGIIEISSESDCIKLNYKTCWRDTRLDGPFQDLEELLEKLVSEGYIKSETDSGSLRWVIGAAPHLLRTVWSCYFCP